MGKTWHSVNDLYFAKTPDKGKAKAQEADDEPKKKNDDPEVRLSDGKFVAGVEGFQFNKKCKVKVKVDYLKKTNRKKVTFKLFVVYNNKEEDLAHQAEGYEENGFAEAEVTLFYGDAYSKALQKDPAAKCSYKFKASHSKGEKEIESELLGMPFNEEVKVDFVEVPDIIFNSDSAMPCLDSQNWLIESAVTALVYSDQNTDKELVLFGHADTTGEKQYNFDLSDLRAKAYKAVLANDIVTWKKLAKERSLIADYQTILKTLTDTHGWSCGPGNIDNKDGPKTQKGVKDFQNEYNTKFSKNLTVDGIVGQQTWEAFLNVCIFYISKQVKVKTGKESMPQCKWGYKGTGIYPCGEQRPIDAKDKDGYKSQRNRRVEVVFYNAGDLSGNTIPPSAEREIPEDTCPITGKAWKKYPVHTEPPVEEITLQINSVPADFAPSLEKCSVKYKVKEGDVVAGSKATITIKDAAGNIVFEKNDLELKNGQELTFEWDGKASDGKYPVVGKGPFSIAVSKTGDPASVSEKKESNVGVVEIQMDVDKVDANKRLVNNVPESEYAVTATVLIKKSDGTKVKTEVPSKVEFSFIDPAPANILHSNTFQYAAGKKLGKRGDASAIFWKANPAFTTTSPDGYKTKCEVTTNTATGSADLGKVKVFFKPSGVGHDTFKIKARILAPDGTTELAVKESDEFTIWRKIKYTKVHTMHGENYIDAATIHAQIAPAFETSGANGAYVLYERDPIQTLAANLSVKYIGVYDATKPNKQANWPADFSPAKLETSPNQMNPTAAELADYAYAGAYPALVAKKAAAKTAIEAKAALWFNAIVADYNARTTGWFNAAAVAGGNTLLAIKYYHPKLSNVGNDGQTNFWPAGISINLANPGSGLNTPGDPDQKTWREVQGFNRGTISVIFKNYGTAARLQIVCRHEIAHGTKSAFQRKEFGTGDHSGSGLMTPWGASNTFSNADSQKLRGEL